jgi:uncharacterized OsmC-like protein
MTTATEHVNGVDTEALQQTIREVKADPKKGIARFSARTAWKGGFAVESTIDGWNLGGKNIPHRFTIHMDEPRELLGQDTHANPQEFLQSAMNACLLNTFVAVCSLQGVKLQSLEIETTGQLDLRGFLGIDSNVPAGYQDLNYTIRVKGDGTREQYEKAHQAMIATSPNYYNLAKPIRLNAKLIVE